MKTYWIGVGLGFCFLLLVGGVQPAAACSCFCDDICDELGDCCWPGCGGQTFKAAVTPLAKHAALITVYGGLTTSMAAGSACLTAVPNLDEFATVESVKLVKVSTGEAIYGFTPNELTTASLDELLAEAGAEDLQGDWLGFHAIVPEDVPDGLATEFQIRVSLEKGTSVHQLISKLQERGVLVTGSAILDGRPDYHHFSVRGLESTVFAPPAGGLTSATSP